MNISPNNETYIQYVKHIISTSKIYIYIYIYIYHDCVIKKIVSALLDLCAGNSPIPGEFSSQRSLTRSFDIFVDLRLNKQLRKLSRRR